MRICSSLTAVILLLSENVFNLCSLPNLVGLKYKHVRRGILEVELLVKVILAFLRMFSHLMMFLYLFFFQAVVCGIFRSGKVDFHPSDDEEIRHTDKVWNCSDATSNSYQNLILIMK